MINSQDYSDDKLASEHLAWVKRCGCRLAKMKIGSQPEDALLAKRVSGDAEVFVDAGGVALGLEFKLRRAGRFEVGDRA